MNEVIYGKQVLKPIHRGLDYEATRLMLEGSAHKIFIMPEQRDDSLEGYGNGFVLEINNKRIGCYWEYDNEFELDENGAKVWNLDEVGIEDSLSSTNQFTTHRFFKSDQELTEALEFISSVFNQYDGAESSTIVDDEVIMVWKKRRQSRLRLTESLQEKIAQGGLVIEESG